MSDINIEFTKGVLFVRLFGKINKNDSKSIEQKVINILEKSGIKYLVFNINELELLEEINLFKKCDNKIRESDGKMILCGKKQMNYQIASDELKAFRMMFAC